MKWTKEQPTEEGFYWLLEWEKNPVVVKVEKEEGKEEEGLLVGFTNSPIAEELEEVARKKLRTTLWSGPLTPPQKEEQL